MWDKPGDFGFGDIKFSAGLGFGVDIPRMGPMRLDYAFPLNPDADQYMDIVLTEGREVKASVIRPNTGTPFARATGDSPAPSSKSWE